MYTPIRPRPGTPREEESSDKVIACMPISGTNSNTSGKDQSNEPGYSGPSTSEEARKVPSSPPKIDSSGYEASVLKPSSPEAAKEFVPIEKFGYKENFPASQIEVKPVTDQVSAQEPRAARPRLLSSGLLDWHWLSCSPGLLDPNFFASFLESSGNLPPPIKKQLVTLLNNIRGELPEIVIQISSSQPNPHFPGPKPEEMKFYSAMAPSPIAWSPYHNHLHNSMSLDRVNHSPVATPYPVWPSVPVESVAWKTNAYPPPPHGQPWSQPPYTDEMFDCCSAKHSPQKQSYLKATLGPQYHPKAPTSRNLTLHESARARKMNTSIREGKSTLSVFQPNGHSNQLSSSLVPQGTKSAWNSVGEKKKKGTSSIENAATPMRLSEALALIEGGQLQDRFACNGLSPPDVCPYPGCGFLINNDFEGLRTHIGSHNPNRPFECNECPSSFHRGQDLVRHRRIHLQIRPYKCPNCPKAFGRRDAQQRHTNRLNCAGSAPTGFGSEVNSAQS